MAKPASKRLKMIEETQDKLIQAARKYFAEKGYSATSMEEFTASVDLTRGALYHHFGSKKGLFAAVVRKLDEEVDEILFSISKQEKDPWKALDLRGIAYLEKSIEPEIQQILLKDAKAILGSELMYIQKRCMDSDVQLIDQAMEEGIIPKSNPRALAIMINGTLFESAFWIAESDNPEERLVETLDCWRILMEGLKI